MHINMGQQEVYDFLKKHRDKGYTSKEIANGLKASVGSVTTCLQKLRNSSDIDSQYGKGIGSSKKNAYVYRI
jgi:hypothetical protein